MPSMIGISARPFSVSVYSTRGGTSANVLRSMIPWSSSARSRSDSVRGLMPSSERSSSQKRQQPSARSRISRIVHLPERMSAVAVTGQLVRIASISVVTALLIASPATASVGSPVRISGATPYPNGCGITGQQTPSSEAEPQVAANPLDPNQVIAVYQQDRFPVDGGALADLAAVSSDGGKTFAQVIPPHVSRCNGGKHERASDPWVAFGPDGTVYASWLTFDENAALGAAGLAGPTALSSQTSTDGGRTWNDPVTIVDQNIYDDREALTPDPHKPGVAYVAWVRRLGSFGENGALTFAKTTDAAKSWSAPQTVYTAGALKLPDPILINVMPDDSLVATFVVINASYAVSSSPVPFDILSMRSTDAGATWSQPVKIGQTVSTTPHDPDTNSEVRSLAIVTTAQRGDALYAAWNEIGSEKQSVLELTSSADGGKTWQKPQLVAKIAGQAFLPALAVLPDGTLGLIWDDTRNDKQGDKQLTTDVWLASSSDAGKTWHEGHVAGPFDALSAGETSSTSVAGHFLGDYQGLVALDGNEFGAVFAASKPLAQDGPSDIFFARVPPQSGMPPGLHRLALTVKPKSARVGKRVRLRMRVVDATARPVARASVRIGHSRATTDRRGRATLAYVFRRAGKAAIVARRRGYRSARVYVRVR
jgi:hypothetical protein